MCNGVTGTVVDIVYVPGTSTHGLPKFIIVYFVTNYIGPTVFPGYLNRAVWLPIHLITARWYTKPTTVGGNCEEHTYSMIPLILCSSWKNFKAQSQTIQGKFSLHLCSGGKEHGLSYVAMSRLTLFSDIGLY